MSKWTQAMNEHNLLITPMDYEVHSELSTCINALFASVGMMLVGVDEPAKGASVVLVDGRVGEYAFCEDSPYYGDNSALCYILFADSTDYVSPFDIVAVLN